MNLTIIIPTINRPEKLARTLGFYDNWNYTCKILVGDSSKDELAEKNKAFIDNLGLNITYKHFDLSFRNDGHVVSGLLDDITTDYCVFQGDDDFLIEQGLAHSIQFLNENPGYVAVNGIRVNVKYGRRGFEKAWAIKAVDTDSDDPVERWIAYIQNGISSQHSVHRTDVWKRMYQNVSKVPLRYFGPELLPCSLTYVQGKVGFLDVLACVFEKDADNRQVDWSKKSFFDYVTDRAFHKSFQIVRKDIETGLIEQGTDKNFAKTEVKKYLWLHIACVLYGQWQQAYNPSGAKPLDDLNRSLRDPKWKHYSEFRRVDLWASTWRSQCKSLM